MYNYKFESISDMLSWQHQLESWTMRKPKENMLVGRFLAFSSETCWNLKDCEVNTHGPKTNSGLGIPYHTSKSLLHWGLFTLWWECSFVMRFGLVGKVLLLPFLLFNLLTSSKSFRRKLESYSMVVACINLYLIFSAQRQPIGVPADLIIQVWDVATWECHSRFWKVVSSRITS